MSLQKRGKTSFKPQNNNGKHIIHRKKLQEQEEPMQNAYSMYNLDDESEKKDQINNNLFSPINKLTEKLSSKDTYNSKRSKLELKSEHKWGKIVQDEGIHMKSRIPADLVQADSYFPSMDKNNLSIRKDSKYTSEKHTPLNCKQNHKVQDPSCRQVHTQSTHLPTFNETKLRESKTKGSVGNRLLTSTEQNIGGVHLASLSRTSSLSLGRERIRSTDLSSTSTGSLGRQTSLHLNPSTIKGDPYVIGRSGDVPAAGGHLTMASSRSLKSRLKLPEDGCPSICSTNPPAPKKLQVPSKDKHLFVIVKKVKEAHECQESGEAQHLLDDVNYLIDGLSDLNPVTARSLSILSLANKCKSSLFRDLIHAHDLIKPICLNLRDAHTNYTLALTAAGLYLVLSRDREPEFLTPDSLTIILKLLNNPDTLETPSSSVGQSRSGSSLGKYSSLGLTSRLARLNRETAQVRSNVMALLAGAPNRQGLSQPQRQATMPFKKGTLLKTELWNTRHLRINQHFTSRDLIFEALLNLGTRKAAAWFKSQLRLEGVLGAFAGLIIDAVDYFRDLLPGQALRRVFTSDNPTGLDEFSLDHFKRVGHYSRLLENMTHMESDNQTHLVQYSDRGLIDRLVKCLRVCSARLPRLLLASHLWKDHLCVDPTISVAQKDVPVSHQFTNDQMILLDCLLAIFRLLINISHDEFASDRLGGCPGLLEVILDSLFHLPPGLPASRRFDLFVLILCLLVNLCQHCPENRIRLVNLEVSVDLKVDAVEGDHSETTSQDNTVMVSVLDEIINLFLYHENAARNHELEREDYSPKEVSEPGVSSSGVLHRPKPPPSLANCHSGPGETIEEAGLKWRLIEDRRNDVASRRRSRQSRRLAFRRRRRLAFCRQSGLKDTAVQLVNGIGRNAEGEASDFEDCDDAEASVADFEDCDVDYDDEDDEDDDEEEGGSAERGADVEFVVETAEERQNLAEHMSSAKQHMEDSVVAAYAALLLGCILQSSDRYAERIRRRLPDGQFRPLAIMLAKLLSFLALTKGVGSSGSDSILRIVRLLEAQDQSQPHH